MENKNYGKIEVYTPHSYSADNSHEKITISLSNFNREFVVAKNCEIMLLNFEDDTFKPVTKDQKKMDIVKHWYDECGIFVDFEPTNYFVQHYSVAQNIFFKDKIFEDFHLKTKMNFLKTYIPLSLVNYEIMNQMKDFPIESDNVPPSPPPTQGSIKNPKSIAQIDAEEKYILNKFHLVIPQKFLGLGSSSSSSSSSLGKKTNLAEKKCEKGKGDVMSQCGPIGAYNDDVSYETEEPQPYNSSFNALRPEFASNCALVQGERIEPASFWCAVPINNDRFKRVLVIFNYKFLCTKVLIDPDTICRSIAILNHEYGFFRLFEISTENSEIIRCIKDKFDNIIFDDTNDLNNNLQNLTEHIAIIEEQANSKEKLHHDEEKQVKQFFEIYYDIDDNIENKMKASQLCDIIANSFLVNVKKDGSFRNRLSRYLADMGLKKKRFNDGFYYYGIKPKAPIDREPPFTWQQVDATEMESMTPEEISNMIA